MDGLVSAQTKFLNAIRTTAMSNFIIGLIKPTIVFTTAGLTFNQFPSFLRNNFLIWHIIGYISCKSLRNKSYRMLYGVKYVSHEKLIPVPILQLDLSYCLNSGFIECKALTKLRSHSQIDCFTKWSFSENDFYQLKHRWVWYWLKWLTTRIMFNIVNIRWHFHSF